MKINIDEILIEENEDYALFTGQFISSTSKESIHYKKARPHIYDESNLYHIIIIHDLFEYHIRHQKFLEYMSKRYKGQLEITWIDLKGHGMSSGTRSHVDEFKELSLDVVTLLNQKQLTLKEHKGRKTVLFGQGLGGMILLDLMMNYSEEIEINIDGLIFSNPDIFMKKNFPAWAFKMLDYAGSFMGSIRVPSPLKGEDLTDEKTCIESYGSDPLINHFCTLSLLNQIMNKARELKGCSYFLEVPCLFLLSDNDVWGDSKKTEIFAKGMSKRYKSLNVYRDAKRELTNSSIRNKVFYDVFSWLKNL